MMKGQTMTRTLAPLPILGADYPDDPVWTPLEVLTGSDPEMMSHAMYYGTVTTRAGIAHGYKHSHTRRTVYLLPEMATRYESRGNARVLVPFGSVADALAWWQS